MKPSLPPYPLFLWLLLLGSFTASFGCNSRQDSHTITYGNTGWGLSDTEEGIPGIDQAMVQWYIRDKQLIYVVWTDLSGGNSSSGSKGGESGGVVQHQANLVSLDGDSFEFEYTLNTNDHESGDAGALKIDGIDYPLINGALVLVSTQRDQVTVKQLDLDPMVTDCVQNHWPSQESRQGAMKALANEPSNIHGFFQSVRNDQ